MIQSAVPKPIEAPKPRTRESEAAEVASNRKAPKAKASTESKESLEESEFDAELEASIGKNEPKVEPVKVSADQVLELPSSLVQPSSVENASPKIFDPELTKGVEKLIGPKTTEVEALSDAEVLKLANAEIATDEKGEFSFTKLKASGISGRAPAIDLAKSEIDPQLLNNEDFVAQKNLIAKKSVPNAYGMKAVPQNAQNVAQETGLKQTQVVAEASKADAVNSQDFILELAAAPKFSQAVETSVAPKVFDMNNLKSSETSEVINQITDYVVQARAAKEPTVNMRIAHEDLGMIDITVTKSGGNQEAIAVNIGTHSLDGKNFFQQNSKDLFSHLTTAGLNISDLKVETPSQTAKNDFDFGSQSGKNQSQSSEKQFGSEQNQRRHEADRRQELWKLLNKEAA